MKACLAVLMLLFALITEVGHASTFTDSLEVQLSLVKGTDKVDVLNELFKAYRNNDPTKAYLYAEEALQLSKQLEYKYGQGLALNNLGVYYKNLGRLDEALRLFIESLKIQEDLQNQQRIAFTLSNIGNIHMIKADYDKALDFYTQALTVFKELGVPAYIIRIYNNIGNVYYAYQNFAEALRYYEQAAALVAQSGQNDVPFDLLTNLGNIYYQQNDYKQALAYYFESLEVERRVQNKYGQAKALFNIGETHRADQQYNDATKYLNQALDIALTLGDKELLSSIYASMANTHFAADNFAQAFLYLRFHMTAKDSLINAETSKKLAELETIYETEKKEKEIELLKKEDENKELQIRNANIRLFGSIFVLMSVLALAVLIYLKYVENQKAKRLLEQQNRDIEAQKEIIENKNQDITDSIQYAKSVQEAIINRNDISRGLPNAFVLFKPKDIVSGDFYWYSKNGSKQIVAVLDCTGHGVAGAFMTIIGNSILNQLVNEQDIWDPAEILHRLDWKVRDTLRHHKAKSTSHGMDVGLCCINSNDNTITFCGARRPLYYIRNNQFFEVKGNKFSISDSLVEYNKIFDNQQIPYNKGDVFYLTSDGYADQFGGEQNRKYMVKKLKQFLLKFHQDTMQNQEERLEIEIDNWKGFNEQTDDMLVIGFKV